MKRRRSIKSEAIFINDLHVGGTTGLLPEHGVVLQDGGRLGLSPLQKESSDHWTAFWKRRKAEKRRIALFLGGDMIEGNHHLTTQVWSNPELHMEAALELLRAPANMADFIYCVSGTPVHVGSQGSADQRIAEQLGATEVYGKRCNYHIRVRVFGVKVDFAHHGPSRGKRPWNRENQLRLYTKGILMQSVASGRETPDLVVRAHRHKQVECLVEYEERRAWGFISPSWQWRTEHGHIVSSEDSVADIGGLVVYIEDGRIVDHTFDCLHFEDVPMASYGQTDSV